MLDDDIQSKERKRLRREKVIRKFIDNFDLTFFLFFSNFNYNKICLFLIIMINVFTNQVVFFLFAGYKYVVLI